MELPGLIVKIVISTPSSESAIGKDFFYFNKTHPE